MQRNKLPRRKPPSSSSTRTGADRAFDFGSRPSRSGKTGSDVFFQTNPIFTRSGRDQVGPAAIREYWESEEPPPARSVTLELRPKQARAEKLQFVGVDH